MVNVNFTHEGANYNVSLCPREDYHFETVIFGDKQFTIRVSFTNNYVTVYKVDEDESPFSTADNQVHSQKLKANKVKASKFLNWYFSDLDDYSTFGMKSVLSLSEHGSVSLSIVDIFNDCGYIPTSICEYKDSDKDEYLPSELLFEDDVTKTNLTEDQKRYYYERGHTSI
jgi:hypothetical protein